MIVYRLICTIMVAWAVNVVLARPEAAELIGNVPEFTYIGPIAGAITGLMILPRKQGDGQMVATLNGAWAGILTIGLAAFLYLTAQMWSAVAHGLISDFENFLRILGTESKPLIEAMSNFRLIGLIIGAVAVAGFVSELVSWFMRLIRRLRGIEEPVSEAKSTVAKAGGPLS